MKMMMKKQKGFYFIPALALPALALVLMSFVSCTTIEKKALSSMADMLSSPGGAGVFMEDDDPRLIGDALPLALKLHEMLLSRDPENDRLAAATGKNFVMYSGAFVQMPASMLDDEEWQEAEYAARRAKKLFRRGKDYLFSALEMRYPEFPALLEDGRYDEAAQLLQKEDAETAYWAALGWLGMASTDPLDMDIATNLDKAVLLLYRALELDETMEPLHGTLIQVYLSLPPAVMAALETRSPHTKEFMDQYYRNNGVNSDSRKRAQFHYYRALTLSGGADPAPHVTMATTVSVKDQDVKGFQRYLGKVLDMNAEDYPENELLIVLYQEKARWLLDHMEELFLVDF